MRMDKAATVINCRCTVALAAKRDANDRLIPKTGLIKSVEPEETKEMKQWVDVPGGWAYGWPKLYDPEKDGDLLEWIHRMGYKGTIGC